MKVCICRKSKVDNKTRSVLSYWLQATDQFKSPQNWFPVHNTCTGGPGSTRQRNSRYTRSTAWHNKLSCWRSHRALELLLLLEHGQLLSIRSHPRQTVCVHIPWHCRGLGWSRTVCCRHTCLWCQLMSGSSSHANYCPSIGPCCSNLLPSCACLWLTFCCVCCWCLYRALRRSWGCVGTDLHRLAAFLCVQVLKLL